MKNFPFIVVIKNIENPNLISSGGIKNKYKGAYKKIFDILNEDSVFFEYEYEDEQLIGNDFYLYFNITPDFNKIEKIEKIPNVEIINGFYDGGIIEDLINKGVVELKFYETKPEHAKEYGLDSINPLFVQRLCVTENARLKGIGNKVLKYIDAYAITNGHDVVFGHITQKANFTKDGRETNLYDIDLIKSLLRKNGYDTRESNNDFHKVIQLDSDVSFDGGGRTISQTPAPKSEIIYGSSVNKSKSSKDVTSAKSIKFTEKTLDAIKNKVEEHNLKNPDKKINLASAKAVVRRGMGAYSKSHRPTITGGKPNSRVAWGLARLNAFTYKIENGKSKSGKYSQDDDLIEELGYKVSKYESGGSVKIQVPNYLKMFLGQ